MRPGRDEVGEDLSGAILSLVLNELEFGDWIEQDPDWLVEYAHQVHRQRLYTSTGDLQCLWSQDGEDYAPVGSGEPDTANFGWE